MDERRFEELERKKLERGLTQEEADELGRMYAEKMGEPYSSADEQAHPEARSEEGKPFSEAEVEEFKVRRGQDSKEE
jgi:hypothetical protein